MHSPLPLQPSSQVCLPIGPPPPSQGPLFLVGPSHPCSPLASQGLGHLSSGSIKTSWLTDSHGKWCLGKVGFKGSSWVSLLAQWMGCCHHFWGLQASRPAFLAPTAGGLILCPSPIIILSLLCLITCCVPVTSHMPGLASLIIPAPAETRTFLTNLVEGHLLSLWRGLWKSVATFPQS